MSRLPTPGSDSGNWGTILNDYLSQALAANGTLKADSVGSTQLQDNAVTANIIAPNSVTNAALATDAVNATIIQDGSITNALIADSTIEETKLASAVQTKLNQTAPVTSVAGKTGVVTLDKTDVGLDNVDDTSDATKNSATVMLTNKTISGSSNTLTNISADSVVDGTTNKVFLATERAKLSGIAGGATANSTEDAAATASTLAVRNGNANLMADAFISSVTSTATASGTTTLTVDSTEIQIFTGTSTQTIVLPTTGIVAGQKYTIINTSSGGTLLVNASGGALVNGAPPNSGILTLVALQAAPTLPAHWVSTIGPANVATSGSSANTIARRDAQSNLLADAFIPSLTSTATAGGTTTLTVDSTEVQVFTGSTTQTVVLPTTGVASGQRFTIINNSSGLLTVNASGGAIVAAPGSTQAMIVTALVATPTVPSQWIILYANMFSTSISPSLGTVVRRDINSNILADAFVPSFTTQVTAAGTTTLTVDSTEVQEFTGSSVQTITLPTTGITAGQRYTIINNASNTLTINASGGAGVGALGGGATATITALVATPTLPAHWSAVFTANYGFAISAVASTVPRRDGNANLLADAFVPGFTSTATAGATTTLTVDSTEVQLFTGTLAQVVLLPTTSIAAGQRFTVLNNSTGGIQVNASDSSGVFSIPASNSATFIAVQATPTTAAHWRSVFGSVFSSSSGNNSNTLALRNSVGAINANSFNSALTSTVTVAGITTLTVSSTTIQLFTGTTTQTCVLPTTAILVGQQFTFINKSTGAITINASDGSLVKTLAGSTSTVITALLTTPVATGDWYAS